MFEEIYQSVFWLLFENQALWEHIYGFSCFCQFYLVLHHDLINIRFL
jgi:hypothetical protein